MLQTRIQLENLSKDELNENFKNEINTVYSELNNCFKYFKAKYEMVNLNLSIYRRSTERLTQLKCNNLSNAHYNKQ